MKPRRLPWLTLMALVVLTHTACSTTPAGTPVAPSPTPIPPTDAPLLATDTSSPPDPALTQTPLPQLDPQATFEVIASIRAQMLIVEQWLEKDLSPAERQAVLYPLVEFGIYPLNGFSDLYIPEETLEEPWSAALKINAGFYLSTLAWTVGESPDEEYVLSLKEDSTALQEIFEEALILAENLDVDTSQYGPDYAVAIEAAAVLLSEIAVEPLPDPPTPGDLNPALVAVQVTPFVFEFAGSDVFFTIGTIENSSAFPQQNVEVEVAFYNFLDEHIGTVRGRLLADVANPGVVYPFIATDLVAGEELALKDWAWYKVSAFSYPVASESYQLFETSNSTSNQIDGKFIVSGTLTNNGDQSAELQKIRIGAVAYDTAGTLIGVGDGQLETDGILAPGDSAPFSLIIPALNGEPASYQFFAEVVE